MRHNLSRVVFLMFLFTPLVRADDWPQFMGPDRNGVARGPVLLSKWSEEGPPRVWSVKCGRGYAGPVLAGNVLVLMERWKEKPEEEVTRGLDARTGRQLWRTTASCAWPAKRGYTWGPSATPAIAKGRVVCLGIEGLLRCHELDSGKVVWERELLKEFRIGPGYNENWGMVTSPLVVDDLVIVQVCSKEADVGLVAWRIDDGKEVWRTPFFGNYSSSPGFTRSGETPVVIACSTGPAPKLRRGDLFGFDGRDGRLLWSVRTGKSYYNCPTPVAGDDMIFLEGGGGDGPTVAVRRVAPDKAEVAWKSPNHLVRFSNHLYYGGLLFGHGYPAHGGATEARLFCIDPKDGALLWETADKDKHQWLLGCDGKVVQLRENGELILFDADARKAYRELARAKVIDTTWSYPALVDGRLYVRSDTQVVCVDLAAR